MRPHAPGGVTRPPVVRAADLDDIRDVLRWAAATSAEAMETRLDVAIGCVGRARESRVEPTRVRCHARARRIHDEVAAHLATRAVQARHAAVGESLEYLESRLASLKQLLARSG